MKGMGAPERRSCINKAACCWTGVVWVGGDMDGISCVDEAHPPLAALYWPHPFHNPLPDGRVRIFIE